MLSIVAVLATISFMPSAVRADADGEDSIDIVRDIAYAERDSGDLLLDAYLPMDEAIRPAMLVVHGGAWRSGSRKQLGFYALKLARAGYACFAINYRLAPAHKFPAQIDDCRDAVKWIRNNADEYKVDPGRLGAIGYSAGGHLVSLLGTTGQAPNDENDNVDTRLQCVAAGGAPCEFRLMPDKGKGLSFWLGGTVDEVPDNFRDASPTAFVSKDDPPTFFFNGTGDRIVPLIWTQPLHSSLKEIGVETELFTIDGANHLQAAGNPEALDAALAFLDRHLKPAPDGKPQSRSTVFREIPAALPANVGMSTEKLKHVGELMQSYVDEGKMAGGIVVVARRGKIVLFREFGLRDVENNKPMKKDTMLRIYSMTKAIVTAATLMLYDDGMIALDDPISKYLPDLKSLKVAQGDDDVPADREMTIRDLMRHTSGLTYGNSGMKRRDELFQKLNVMDEDSDLTAMSRKIGQMPLAFSPGTRWHYGISIDVLGHLIEVVSGQPLDEFLQQRMFDPLDMKDTGFFVPEAKRDRLAVIYRAKQDGSREPATDAPLSRRQLKKDGMLSGGGGLVSTARDYMRFLMMIQNGGQLFDTRVLKADTVAAMITNQLPDGIDCISFGDQIRTGVGFGLGFSVRFANSDWDPDGRVGEYGWGGLASTHYWVSPKDDLIVVTMEQTLPFNFDREFGLKKVIYDAIID